MIGKAGELAVLPGYYLYVGSARGPGGLHARAGRHLRGSTALRWHIDYLRRITHARGVWLQAGREQVEHNWAATLQRMPGLAPAMRKFGASDCTCNTHLFYTAAPPAIDLFRQQLEQSGLAANVTEVCS
jgi:Uri superfamily endonuclease